MHVIGTAGHVDHGKSSLVRALTGTDPDRWLEERVRGMSLDLGFAHLRFDDGTEAGIVDVPGHERFLHNMLAGAAGMEMLLLVVDVNEGPRTQTLEHLAILQYLNVRKTLVVASKIDLVAEDDRAFALEMLRDGLHGTMAAGARVFAVSSTTGEGLDALREAIHAELRALPPRAPDAPAYLPVDRAFALPGHGTIVTGTLMQGRIAVGDRLRLTPLDREVRVRSLQIFGRSADAAQGGARVAVNLPGVEVADVHRGAVLAAPELAARDAFVADFRPLPGARSLMRRRTPVRAYVGSAEVLGTLVLDQSIEDDSPIRVTLRLRTPVAAPPGGAFVLRRLSPKDVLGGGRLDAMETPDAGDASGDDIAAPSPEAERVAAALRAAGIAGESAERLGALANVRAALAAEILEGFVAEGRAIRVARPDALVDAQVAAELFARIDAALAEGETSRPWSLGVTSVALARKLGEPESNVARLLFALADDGRLALRNGYFSTPGFEPRLTAEQRAFFNEKLSLDSAAPNVPFALDELTAAVKTSRIEGLAQALDTLFATGALVKVGDAVYRRSQIARIREALEKAATAKGTITPAEFRDAIGTSRKFAVPLLEFFDATGITLRSGDARVLRQSVKA